MASRFPVRNRWVRRHPVLTGVFLAIALPLIVVALVSIISDRDTVLNATAIVAVLLIATVLTLATIVDQFQARAGASIADRGADDLVANSTEPDAPPGHSAFVETAHRPLPASHQPSHLTLDDLLTLSPTEFEDFCVKALEGIGYTHVKRTGGSGDLAADVVARDLTGASTIVQCKRYQPGAKIGSPAVQMFIGMKNVHHRADRGIYMTTAEYSAPAMKLARQHDLVLIDGDDLVKIAALVIPPDSAIAGLP